MTTYLNIAAILLVLAFASSPSVAVADSRIDAWKQEELTEDFMRALTKRSCMDKTVASLKAGCSTNACLKTLAGINGDCATWASGEIDELCLNYDRDYISKYCATNELEARQCIVLHVARPTKCKSHPK